MLWWTHLSGYTSHSICLLLCSNTRHLPLAGSDKPYSLDWTEITEESRAAKFIAKYGSVTKTGCCEQHGAQFKHTSLGDRFNQRIKPLRPNRLARALPRACTLSCRACEKRWCQMASKWDWLPGEASEETLMTRSVALAEMHLNSTTCCFSSFGLKRKKKSCWQNYLDWKTRPLTQVRPRARI
jgi:hypothetical protein